MRPLPFSLAVPLVGFAFVAPAISQTVDVDSGQILQQSELEAGFFDDDMAAFTLGVGTIFNINDGGRMEPVGTRGIFESFFNFQGSTLNLNSGGVLDPGSLIRNLSLNVRGGSVSGVAGLRVESSSVDITDGSLSRLLVGAGSDLDMHGGVIDSLRLDDGGTATISGGSVGDNAAAFNGELLISGGTVGNNLEAGPGGTITVTGGQIGDDFHALSGSEINIEGGSVGDSFMVTDALVNMSGGVTDSVRMFSGSRFNQTGGRAVELRALEGSELHISGGVSWRVVALSGSSLVLEGGDFKLNGASVSDLSGGLGVEDVFTGTLADGSVVIYRAGDFIAPGTTTLVDVPLDPIDTTPMVVTSGTGPNGLRPGQTLTLRNDATLDDSFGMIESTLVVEGGSVGRFLESVSGVIDIEGGEIGDRLYATSGSVVTLNSGSIGEGAEFRNGSELHIRGGSVEPELRVYDGVLSISGGTIGGINGRIDALDSSVEISGGEADRLYVYGGTLAMSGGAIGRVTVDNTSNSEIEGGQLDRLNILEGSQLLMNGGTVLEQIFVADESVVRVSGDATVNSVEFSQSSSGGVLHVDGGSVGDIQVAARTTVNITGGTFTGDVFAEGGSTVNIFGTSFFRDGEELTDLELGAQTEISTSGSTLSGVLADGSSFELMLYDFANGTDFFEFGSTLTVTLVPAPGTLALLGLAPLATRRRRRG